MPDLPNPKSYQYYLGALVYQSVGTTHYRYRIYIQYTYHSLNETVAICKKS